MEKIGPTPYTFYFYFCIFFCFFFVIFLPCFAMTWAIFLFFLYFFMFTIIGIPDIERRKRKRNLLIGQPQGSLSERIDTVCIC